MTLLGAVRRLVELAIAPWPRLVGELDHRLAFGQTGDLVRATIEGQAPRGAKLCLFVHFDAQGVIRPHTRRYLGALLAAGLTIVLIANAGRLAPESLAFARARCWRVLLRRNRGYDFGAWRDGLARCAGADDRWTLVLLANDSVYGPLTPLAPLLERADLTTADVWGATDSWQQRYHLQSYWLMFGPAALAHPAFAGFWRGVRNVRGKWAVIRHGEVRLSQVLLDAGLRLDSLWEYEALLETAMEAPDAAAGEAPLAPEAAAVRRIAEAARRRVALNPPLMLWRTLLEAGFPFVKRELLRDDPVRAADILLWHEAVRARSPGVHAEIVRDLRRVRRGGAP